MFFVGIGDLHLGSQSGGSGISRFGFDDEFIMGECQRVVDWGTQRGVENFFFYGDICHQWRMGYQAHMAFVNFLKRNKDVRFHCILGNHDKFAKREGNSLEILSLFRIRNLSVYDNPTTVEFGGGCRVRFMSYPFASFEKGSLNVCHLDINGARDGKRIVKSDVDPKNFQIVSGHIHNMCEFRDVHYSGSLFPMAFGDSNKRYFHLIEGSKGGEFEVTNIPFKSKLRLETVRVDNDKELNLREDTIYRLIVAPNVELNPSVLKGNVFRVCNEGAEEGEELNLAFEYLDLETDTIFKHLIEDSPNRDELIRVREECLSV